MSNELLTLYNSLPTPNYGNITLINREILRFESAEHFEQVYENLYAHYQAWNELFIATYDTGSEEDLDNIIENLNFNENWPLFKFEERHKKGIISATLLEIRTQSEERWLEEGGRGAAPTDEIVSCPAEQALLSLFHEYCIGDTICQIRPNGYEILIHVSEISRLNEIRNLSISQLLSRGPVVTIPEFPKRIILSDPPVTILDPNEIDCSKSYFKNEGMIENDYCPGYKFKWKYNYRSNWSGEKVKTTVSMTNYKWNSTKDKYVKDYGSFCKIEFWTRLNGYYYDTKECVTNVSAIGENFSNNTKVVWKSVSGKTFAEVFEVVSYVPWEEEAVACVRHNDDESIIYIRHKGIKFEIYAKTGNYIIY